ncbi:hypothetical protein PILCRDRAFT_477024 [Piloderma croceum F 1598]|uniref:G domain-containing protein n=1 Tax=Piloderma croceum (strain F 1598) TaxID=765440 RepID=A0A0C3FCJ1_PILCF|nr:hypothetical protein PILCRDRAFT_477024 [Piloderma croceum F 1598]
MSAHTTTSSSINPGVQISDITIRVTKPGRSLDSVDLLIGEKRPELHWNRIEEQVLQATINPTLKLSSSHLLNLRLHYRRWLVSNERQEITINAAELLHSGGEGEIREWRQSYSKIEVKIIWSYAMPNEMADDAVHDVAADHLTQQRDSANPDTPLPSMTDEILRICPRFRILVIGKVGVGKSSLINKTFGVEQAVDRTRCHSSLIGS